MILSVRPRAERDISDAFDWYEARRSGLGDDFLESVDRCFARVTSDPELYATRYGHVRRARLRRFVYFVVRSERIDVLAVYHARRRPRRFVP